MSIQLVPCSMQTCLIFSCLWLRGMPGASEACDHMDGLYRLRPVVLYTYGVQLLLPAARDPSQHDASTTAIRSAWCWNVCDDWLPYC